MPGVTYEKTVEFTPHGAVVAARDHGAAAGRPAGCTSSRRCSRAARSSAARERVTQIEKDVSSRATVAGINGDLFSATDGHPAGIFMSGGVLAHPPLASRSSIGVDLGRRAARRPGQVLRDVEGHRPAPRAGGLNQQPKRRARSVLFTPAYGAARAGDPRLGRGRAAGVPRRDAERRPDARA